MNSAINLEHRASSSRGKHEGEPSLGLCDRLDRTRDNSQRRLPTDHDYAVPTREYQTDQSSLKSAQAAARPVLGKQRQQQKQPHYYAELTRSLHIRPMRSSNYSDRSMSSPSCRVTGFSGSHAISQLRKDVRQCCSFCMEREQQCMPERICPLRQHECSCLTDPAGLRYARADPAPESRLRDTRRW
jgi:hypothetical protein